MNFTTEPKSPPTDVPSLPGLLVEPAWLKRHLGEPGLRPVDLRDPDSYRESHVPGAVHVDLAELGTTVDGRENVLIPPEEFGELMAARGVSNGDAVVAYDDQWGLAAARLAWALHRYGHREVAVLNGGWDRWLDEGGPTATDAGVPDARGGSGRFEARPRADVYADTEWIARRIEAGDARLVDSRTPTEFEAGHLPGAISWDWFNAVPPGSWEATRDPEELRAEWERLGLDPGNEVTVYCRSGMRAAHTWLVLRNAGFERARLYDGSWQEWSMTMEGGDGH